MMIFVWAVTINVATAQPYCDIRTYSIRDGLAANVVSGMGQSPDGLMWFGTYHGLCTFDGYQFMSFSETGGDQLSSNRIAVVKPNSHFGVWVITYDRGLYLLDTRTCAYREITLLEADNKKKPFHARNVYTFPENGHTWITSDLSDCCLRVSDRCPDSMQLIGSRQLPLLNRVMKKVLADDEGREWIFTDGGVTLWGDTCRLLMQAGQFEHLATVEKRTFLAETNGHLYCYEQGASQLKPVALTPAPHQIHCLKASLNNQLFIGTDEGVLQLDTRTLTIRQIATGTKPVSHINIDSNDRVWAFTDDGQVLLYAAGDLMAHIVPMDASRSMLSTLGGKHLWLEDGNGIVWMVPEQGCFCYYDEVSHSLLPYVLPPEQYYLTSGTAILKYYIDQQRNLWFTSGHELTLVNLKYHHIRQYLVRPDVETRSVLSLSDGTIWAGTYDGYIVVFNADGRQQGYLGRQGRVVAQPEAFSTRIYAMRQDTKGRIWICTKGDGLYLIDGVKMNHFLHQSNDTYSLSHNEVYDIDEDERGNIWIGTHGRGLNLVSEQADGNIRFIHVDNRMTTYPVNHFGRIRRITHDGQGTVILSTTGGLLTFDNRQTDFSKVRFYASQHIKGDSLSIRTSDVLQALVTRSGRVCVTTMGGSLQWIASDNLLADNLRCHSIHQQHEGNVLSLVEDLNGYVWAVREASVEVFTPQMEPFAEYGSNDIGEHSEFTEALPSLNKQDGRMWLPMIGGLMGLHPDELRKSRFQPNIVFTSVRFQGDAHSQPLLHAEVLRVPSDRRSLTLFFAALDYQQNELMRYAWRMDDDKEWNFVGNDHQAHLNHIPAGRHRLVVCSTNCDGVWMDNETTLVIEAEPTFWETIWARLLYVLLIVLAIGTAIHIYMLRRKAALQREMDEMKSRFYTDVGHQLRTPLTLIGGPVAEVLAQEKHLADDSRTHLEMVQRNARHMLSLVNKMLNRSEHSDVYVSDQTVSETPAANTSEQPATKPTTDIRLLVVEDNADLRSFLVSILRSDYQVMEASNGKEGLEKALQQPDFIITDVTMPEMDGLTMVHEIKQNTDICHIPIVVLSAKASLNDRLQGLREGIDDYITKPFSATYLRQRIENIISQRRMLQQRWLGQLDEAPREYRLEAPEIIDADQKMMEQLMKFLEGQISNADLRIEDMADAVCMGRTVFYSKLRSIVGMSPSDFLRRLRMQRAEVLIVRSQQTVSQIAYAVGYSDPKYFAKCFKKDTGMTPSEYRESKKNDL